LGLCFAFRAPAFCHLPTERQPRLCVGDEGGEASVACVALGDVAFEIVSWFGSAWHDAYHI